jgi:hypothetical protein
MRLFLPSLAFLAVWLVIIPPAPAEPPPGQLCRGAIDAAERAQRTPDHLLLAIAKVESGRVDPRSGAVQPWPWTINAQGVGRFFDTKAEAIAAVEELQARGVRSIDVGCMQVNLMHHPNAFASLDEAFEPRANAWYAARFLNALYRGSGSWTQAAAAYHSQTEAIGADYARKVMAVWGRPMDRPLPAAPEPPTKAFAALSIPEEQYRAFAPQNALFGAFVSPAGLPASWRGFAGLPAAEEHKQTKKFGRSFGAAERRSRFTAR